MNPEPIEMIISQFMFWGIFVFSYLIFRAFQHSVDGKLRLLIMELFLAKMFAYGLAGAYYLMWDFGCFQNTSALWLRITCNVPMVVVMMRLYRYIKYKK